MIEEIFLDQHLIPCDEMVASFKRVIAKDEFGVSRRWSIVALNTERHGEPAGHKFRGNQYTGGKGGDGKSGDQRFAPGDPKRAANFQKWFSGSKVVDSDGEPLVVYHGTASTFDEFDPDKANVESDLGAGFYFTNEQQDVGSNYAGEGPDLTQRIEMRADEIEQSLSIAADWIGKDPDDIKAEALRIAREALHVEHGGAALPVHLAIKKPVIIGSDDETYLDFEESYNSKTDEYGEPKGKLVKFVNALKDASGDFHDHDIDSTIASIMERASGEGMKVSDLFKILESGEGLSYATDDHGKLVSKEIIRRAFERMGFDGIIDHSADKKFGSSRDFGKKMAGMNPDTVHYIAFKPNQIKSAIGNRGTFSKKDKRITHGEGPGHPFRGNQWTGGSVDFEVAPDPNNHELVSQWTALRSEDRTAITKRVAEKMIPKILKAHRASGRVVSQVGSYLEDTNPSVSLRLSTRDRIDGVAKSVGFVLAQDSVMVTSRRPFDGSSPVDAIHIHVGAMPAHEIAGVYKKLHSIVINGEHPIGGQSTRNGKMAVLNLSSVKTPELMAAIDSALGGKHDIDSDTMHASFPEKKDYNYADKTTHDGKGSGGVLWSRNRILRKAAAAYTGREIAKLLGKAGKENHSWEEVEAHGESDGHPFRGNQWTDGQSGAQHDGRDGAGGDGPGGNGSGGRGASAAPSVDSGSQPKAGGAGGRAENLEGLPSKVKVDGEIVEFGAFQPAHDAARAYMEKAGLPYNPPKKYAKVDVERATKIAGEFEKLQHNPADPETKAAYRAMIDETIAQYEEILKTGIKIELIEGPDPYGNPRHMTLDVVKNNHMFVFPTDAGFGSSAGFDPTGNPLLEMTTHMISGKPVHANTIFRAVHDYFGHVKDGVGFRADGEENAWRSHSAMYSKKARLAMTTETRGQSSWLNFSPKVAVHNKTAKAADTIYADQKVGLLPDWVTHEGAGDD